MASKADSDEMVGDEAAIGCCARLFGVFSLSNVDGVSLLPQARKTRALLAYLILADGEPVSRQKLMGLAWSERGEEQARASLRQSLYEARTLSAGDTPILSASRNLIRLDRTRLRTDFDTIIAREGYVEALVESVADGLPPLLDDLDDIDPMFDAWLATERSRRRERVIQAVERTAEQALAIRDAAGAERLSSFLLKEDPCDERAACLLMAASHLGGDRSSVHRIFERLKAELRRELDVSPSARTVATYRALMDDPPTGGYQPDIIVPHVPDATPPPPPATSEEARAGPATVSGRRYAKPGIIALVLVASLTGGWHMMFRPREAFERVVAVEPLQAAAGDRAAQSVRLGLSDDLASVLVGGPSRFSVRRVDGSASASSASLALSGSAATVGQKLHVDVRLADTRSGGILWSGGLSGDASQPDEVGEQVATKIGAVLNCALDVRNGEEKDVTEAAVRLYLTACDRIGDYDLDGALDLFRQVTILSPGFARAWADLATTQAFLAEDLPEPARQAGYRKAAANARHALSLNPDTGLAYYALARTMPGIDNWQQRIDAVTKGLGAEPDGSELNNQMGVDLLDVGRTAEGIDYLKRSANDDPLDPVKTAALIQETAFSGRLDDAEKLVAQADRRWPVNSMIWTTQFGVEAWTGDPRRAQAMLEDPRRPDIWSAADVIRWRLFLKAREFPTKPNVDAAVSSILSPDSVMSETPLDVARDLVLIGRVDLAYSALAASQEPWGDDDILFHAYMAPFRADPRFAGVVRRQGLQAIWRRTQRWPDICSQRGTSPVCQYS